MRQLLRKSRNLLFRNGKIQSYILYSVGEIVLVVIGILIALSIDNWNENRKDSIQEQEILIQLQNDYKTNLLQLDEKIELRNLIIHSCESVLKAIDNPIDCNKDSLITQLGNVLIDPTFDPVNDNLINSGKINLIKNKKLSRLLTNLSSDIAEVREIELEWQKLINEIVIPLYIEIGISRVAVNSFWNKNNWFLDKGASHGIDLGKSKESIKTNELLENPKLDDMLSIAVLFNLSGNIQSYALRSRILEILDLADKEIKNAGTASH